MKFVVLYFTFQVVGGREPSCINRMQESESHPPFVVPPNFSDSTAILTQIARSNLRYLDPSRYFFTLTWWYIYSGYTMPNRRLFRLMANHIRHLTVRQLFQLIRAIWTELRFRFETNQELQVASSDDTTRDDTESDDSL